jgi:hypothetical protein
MALGARPGLDAAAKKRNSDTLGGTRVGAVDASGVVADPTAMTTNA